MFAIYYNELLNRVGFVFRDRFKSEAIYDKYYLHNCIKYIHNNLNTIGETKEWIENYVHLIGYPSLESVVGNDAALLDLVINMKNECGIKNKEISQILHIDKSKLSRLLKK